MTEWILCTKWIIQFDEENWHNSLRLSKFDLLRDEKLHELIAKNYDFLTNFFFIMMLIWWKTIEEVNKCHASLYLIFDLKSGVRWAWAYSLGPTTELLANNWIASQQLNCLPSTRYCWIGCWQTHHDSISLMLSISSYLDWLFWNNLVSRLEKNN